jgi:hypothetical protein
MSDLAEMGHSMLRSYSDSVVSLWLIRQRLTC